MMDSTGVILGVLILVITLFQSVSRSNRSTAVFMVFQGAALGIVYLFMGLEFLAIIQWIMATVFGVLLLLFAIESVNQKKKWVATRGISAGLVVGGWITVGFLFKAFHPIEINEPIILDRLSSQLVIQNALIFSMLLFLVFISIVGVSYVLRRRYEGERL